MSKRNRVNYVENDEPAFIKQFKQKIGYKEGPNVDTKRQKFEDDEVEDRSDNEEEKPVVVVLKAGDLTSEEVDEEEALRKQAEEAKAIREGKITFKKPTKKGPDGQSAELSEKTDDAQANAGEGCQKTKDKKKREKKEKVKNSLLSFGDEEEEDG